MLDCGVHVMEVKRYVMDYYYGAKMPRLVSGITSTSRCCQWVLGRIICTEQIYEIYT